MPSTHLALHVHVVFGTKARAPLIATEWRARLHAYLGGILQADGAAPIAIGGTADHVHLLIGFRATHALADLVRNVKRASTVWVLQELCIRPFGWQEGYGAFTVSPGAIEDVRRYILGQEAHHRKRSFREEYEEFLALSGVEFNPDYVWD